MNLNFEKITTKYINQSILKLALCMRYGPVCIHVREVYWFLTTWRSLRVVELVSSFIKMLLVLGTVVHKSFVFLCHHTRCPLTIPVVIPFVNYFKSASPCLLSLLPSCFSPYFNSFAVVVDVLSSFHPFVIKPNLSPDQRALKSFSLKRGGNWYKMVLLLWRMKLKLKVTESLSKVLFLPR